MYDSFSEDYDRFVNWTGRLAYEMPFLEKQIKHLQKSGKKALKILDSACGTGMHAIELAKQGHAVSAADLFPQMVRKGQENARQANVEVQFSTSGFGGLTDVFGRGQFDLVLCLGNSLPHILNENDLIDALKDFASALRKGGMLFIQNRNFDAVMNQKSRWMEPQVFQAEGKEWIFQRFYDFLADGSIRFNIVTLKRAMDGDWQAGVGSTLLRPQLYEQLNSLLADVGFKAVQAYGNMEGEPFNPSSSGNLILTAIKN
jgi:SAM-dependent methyltransferase